MTETASVEQGNTVDTQEARTFTQEEVNGIVQERVRKEREKYSDIEQLREKAKRFDEIEEAQKTELQKVTERAEQLENELESIKKENSIRQIKQKIENETGVPMELLTFETEEDCRRQATAIANYSESRTGYPVVKDHGETKAPTKSKADILAIKNERERLKAIQENIELFN